MARIICEVEHFYGEVNGITFNLDRGQWLSPEISDEQAAFLASVPGYRLVRAPEPASQAPKGKAKATAIEAPPATEAPAPPAAK